MKSELSEAVRKWRGAPAWAKTWIISGLSVESEYWSKAPRADSNEVNGTWTARSAALRLLRAADGPEPRKSPTKSRKVQKTPSRGKP